MFSMFFVTVETNKNYIMATQFIFKGFDKGMITEGILSFHYSLVHDKESWNFTERIFIDTEYIQSQQLSHELLSRTLTNIAVFFGMSYWKLFCPSNIVLDNIELTKEEARFWTYVYTYGLAQFYYENNIDYRGLIDFPSHADTVQRTISAPRQERSLLLIGGGKDSLVSAELLKKSGKIFTPFVMGESRIQTRTLAVMGMKPLVMKRELDPQLFELNKRADVYNGHVPISIAYALCAYLACVLYDYNTIIASNEASASFGSNVMYLENEVNHQWSKGMEFEREFMKFTHSTLTRDITYFSLLRPLHEIKIVELFSHYPKYFPVFSSCNKNFVVSRERQAQNWCNECAKCAFVFSLLAAFLTQQQLLKIFGENLFNKETLRHLFRQMLGLEPERPFDCVGTEEETIVAFALANEKGKYNDTLAMRMFVQEVLPRVTPKLDAMRKKVFSISNEHCIPKKFLDVINVMKPSV